MFAFNQINKDILQSIGCSWNDKNRPEDLILAFATRFLTCFVSTSLIRRSASSIISMITDFSLSVLDVPMASSSLHRRSTSMISRGMGLVAEEGAAKGDALDRYNSYTITLTYLSSQHYFLSSHYMTE